MGAVATISCGRAERTKGGSAVEGFGGESVFGDGDGGVHRRAKDIRDPCENASKSM